MSGVLDLSIAELGRAYRAGNLSPVAVTRAALDLIAAIDGDLHSFNTVVAERALADAERAEQELRSGIDRGPMHGIPIGVKDIYDSAGILTSCQSRLREGNVPAADAHSLARLVEGGAVMLGKCATIEFATGGPSDETLFPPAHNPWNLAHVPGGSSSGSAAAVASGIARMALGSDTGGSIRGPAALCGTVGIKPTYGRVSRRGVAPLSFTLDHCGPLAWTVEDAALSLGVMAGFDPLDPASANLPVPDFSAGLDRGVAGLRIGFVDGWIREDPAADPEVVAALEAAAALFRALGAVVEPVALPSHAAFHACGRTILLSESYAIHEHDLVERPEMFGRPTRERLMVGAFVRGSDYVEAMRMRRELAIEVNNVALGAFDLLLTPASLTTAGRFDDQPDDPLRLGGMMTIPFNVTGSPAMSLCCGYASSGLPLSMQIAGRAFDEATVFRAGAAYEAATAWRDRRPEISQAVLAAAAQ